MNLRTVDMKPGCSSASIRELKQVLYFLVVYLQGLSEVDSYDEYKNGHWVMYRM
jgi:hypothetical protein